VSVHLLLHITKLLVDLGDLDIYILDRTWILYWVTCAHACAVTVGDQFRTMIFNV
jgi:hypothetical protein